MCYFYSLVSFAATEKKSHVKRIANLVDHLSKFALSYNDTIWIVEYFLVLTPLGVPSCTDYVPLVA